jgi:hypothetical protein
MFRKKGTAESRQLLEGVNLTTLVHGEKSVRDYNSTFINCDRIISVLSHLGVRLPYA